MTRTVHPFAAVLRPLTLCIGLAGFGCGPTPSGGGAPAVDLAGLPIDPFASAEARAHVLLFVGSECPVSNRYAPVVRDLARAFAGRGVEFWLIYPDPEDTPEIIGQHLAAFDYPGRVLRDPGHSLVRTAGVTVTPEAAVFDGHAKVIYRGRIDDRYVAFGKVRPAPTRNDLEIALEEFLSGEAVTSASAPAVGCYIRDLK